MQTYLKRSLPFALSLLLAAPGGRLAAMKGVPKQMEFQDFIGEIKGKGAFSITVEGATVVSFHTGRRYVHYETVASWGKDDPRATHRILYHTENDITFRHGKTAVTVSYRRVRTHLAPTVERTIERSGLDSSRGERDASLRELLDGEGVDRLILAEYGLEPGRTYHAMLKTERYHLPPREPGGKPQRRENTVMVISDRPLPNDVDATPLYRGWSY